MTGLLLRYRTLSPARLAPIALLLLAALLPIAYIAQLAIAASRNIVFWDEFDTALDLIVRLHAGADWNEILHRFFAINNEHRMFTSRLLFATSYWVSGTVNFHVIGAIGNLFVVGACVLLVDSVVTRERRVRLAVLLAFLVFQLENFENFLWSGASIDHFQVVMLAVAALIGVARGTRPALLVAGLFAFLATFTLAHGCMVWVIGALMLAHDRRWSHLALWGGLAAVVLLAFFNGFQINPGHRIADFSPASLGRLCYYWLTLLGGPLALGNVQVAPLLGLGLLVAFGVLGARDATRTEPVLFPMALFTIGALGLVALGRTEVAGGQILSRYMILGTVAWALLFFMVFERFSSAARPYRLMLWCLPALALFNLSANAKFAPLAEGYAEARDRAATRFSQYGNDGHGPVRLHPQEGHARALLQLAAKEGIYSLPSLCELREFSAVRPSSRIISHIDERTISPRSVYLAGWAMIPNQLSRRGQVHVVLKSKQRQLIYSTVTIQRPDVAKAYDEPRWRLSGFRFVVSRDRLPAEDFQVGLLIAQGGKSEFVLTDQWLRLSDPNSTEPWLANDS